MHNLINEKDPVQVDRYREFQRLIEDNALQSYSFAFKVQGTVQSDDLADVLMFLRDMLPLANFYEYGDYDGDPLQPAEQPHGCSPSGDSDQDHSQPDGL